jgi:hypothetical protein
VAAAAKAKSVRANEPGGCTGCLTPTLFIASSHASSLSPTMDTFLCSSSLVPSIQIFVLVSIMHDLIHPWARKITVAWQTIGEEVSQPLC